MASDLTDVLRGGEAPSECALPTSEIRIVAPGVAYDHYDLWNAVLLIVLVALVFSLWPVADFFATVLYYS